MKDENGRLYKLLSERDFEIRQLKKKAEDTKHSSLSEFNEIKCLHFT